MRRRTSPLALLALFIAGCGGHDHHSGSTPGSSSTDTIGPQIALAWPARARDFAAPSAATAALVTFPGGGANGNDVSQVLTRPTGTAAASQTYQLGIAVHPGRHLLRVDFLADANSGGTPLATATVNVIVENEGTLRDLNGKSLGTVAYGSNVTGLTIADGQAVEMGATADLVVTATTTGGVVALTPGSVTFAVASGAANLTIGANGSVTGVAAGTATLTATTGGVTSPAATVAVLPAPIAARTLALTTSDLIVSPTRGLLYAALPSTTANGNSVQAIDPSTGALGARIAVGADPNVLAISDDGSTLYAGLQSADAVRRVDLTTGTAGDQFTVPPDGFGSPSYAFDLDVQPGHSSTVALTRRESEGGGYNGPAVFDDGVERPDSLGIYQGLRLLWTASNRIVSYQSDSGLSGFEDVAVDAQGATLVRTASSSANLSQRIALAGGRLYSSNGVVTDAATLVPLGRFARSDAASSSSFYGPAVDVSGKRAYYLELDIFASPGTIRLHVYNTDTFAEISKRRVTGVTLPPYDTSLGDLRLGLVGTSRLAFRLPDQVVFLDGVSGL